MDEWQALPYHNEWRVYWPRTNQLRVPLRFESEALRNPCKGIMGEPEDDDQLLADNDFSPIDREFRRKARRDPELLNRSTFQVLDEAHQLLTYKRQPWPTFLGSAKMRALKDASLAVSRLLRLVPERVFRGEPVRMSEFYGLHNPDVVELLMGKPNGIEGAVSRGDLIDTPDGFKCIEFNMGANLGGWETGILAEMTLGIPAIARFLREHDVKVGFTDTVHVLFEHILDEALRYKVPTGDEINLAFTTQGSSRLGRSAEHGQFLNTEYRKIRERVDRSLTGTVVRCDDDEFTTTDRGVFHKGLQIHAIVEVDSGATLPEVYKAFKIGQVLLYNGPNNFMMTSKRNIALLSEHRNSDCFSADEQELIRRHIPWTTLMLPHYVDYEGERVFLPDLLVQERDRFVIKDSLSAGGSGVRLGRFTQPAAWEAAVEAALEAGDWLAQEILQFRPQIYQNGDYGCSPHNVIWGPFVFGGRYAGVILRMQPAADPGAVNLSLTATEGIAFEV